MWRQGQEDFICLQNKNVISEGKFKFYLWVYSMAGTILQNEDAVDILSFGLEKTSQCSSKLIDYKKFICFFTY